MKTNLLLKAKKIGMGSLFIFWNFFKFMVWVFPKLILLALMLTPPVAGGIKLHFWGALLGTMISAALTYAVVRIVKEVKAGKTKGLLVTLYDGISIGSYSTLSLLMLITCFGFFTSSGNAKDAFQNEWWPGIIFLYLGAVVVGSGFGIFIIFGETSFSKAVAEYNSEIESNSDEWKRKRKNIILFNPISLPFSLVGYLLFFIGSLIVGMFKVIWLGIQESFQEGAQRINAKT